MVADWAAAHGAHRQHSVARERAMRRLSVLRPIALVIVAALAAKCVGWITVHAQAQDSSQYPQDFSGAFAKADAACKALWGDHVFDPLRDKIPIGGQKP